MTGALDRALGRRLRVLVSDFVRTPIRVGGTMMTAAARSLLGPRGRISLLGCLRLGYGSLALRTASATALVTATTARGGGAIRLVRGRGRGGHLGALTLLGTPAAASALGLDEDVGLVDRLGGDDTHPAVKLGKGHLHVGGLQVVKDVARDGIWSAGATELL